jgi:hypothetical protein
VRVRVQPTGIESSGPDIGDSAAERSINSIIDIMGIGFRIDPEDATSEPDAFWLFIDMVRVTRFDAPNNCFYIRNMTKMEHTDPLPISAAQESLIPLRGGLCNPTTADHTVT